MNPAFPNTPPSSIGRAFPSPDDSSGLKPSLMLLLTEQDADTAAVDWQIVLHLKALFARDPVLISSLLGNPEPRQPAPYAVPLLAAAREALRARPTSADLHYQVAKLVARLGEPQEAAALLGRALTLNPDRADARALLSAVCRQPNKPRAVTTGPQRGPAAGIVSFGVVPPVDHDRRGNELPT